MKILFYLFMGFLAIVAIVLFSGYRYISKIGEGGYKVRNERVFYIGKLQGLGSRPSTELCDVDLATFKALKHGFARDGAQAYFVGRRIPRSHAPSFRTMKYHFAKDRDWVYYQDKPISQLPEDFKVLNREYGRDQLYAYYRGEVVEGSRGANFRLLRHGYARDYKNVYYKGKIISQDAEHFKIIKYENGNAFAVDSQREYINGTVRQRPADT